MAKMDLFGISGELQFRVCDHGKACASPHMAREGKHCHREEKEAGNVIVKQSAWL